VSGTAPERAVLEIDGLKTHIRRKGSVVHAVDGISLTVAEGQTVGLLGESGCGKSMTALSVLRLLPPGGQIVAGSIAVNGRDVVSMSDHEIRQMRGNDAALIFQDPMTSLNPTMTIGRQIAEAVRTHRKVPVSTAMERAEEMLGLVGMPHPAERLGNYPHQMSGGLRQRAMIAMALSCGPRLLIADEPTTALDVTIQAQILSLLDDLKQRLGMAVLLITHDLGVIAEHADRVVVMYAGKVVEQASTAEIFAGGRHPYTEGLLASVLHPGHAADEILYSIPGSPPDLRQPPPGCRFAPRCRYVTDECRTAEPTLRGADGHQYACLHPVGPGPARAPEASITKGTGT
jgi:peptide/nickel transport system ATP-binding protein